MKSVLVNCAGSEPYQVKVGRDLLCTLGELVPASAYSKVFILTEAIIEEHWFSKLSDSLQNAPRYLLTPGEGSKSLQSAEKVWSWLLEQRADRQALVINIGGGMVTDLGGFVASTYMRGISFINVPSTLLSQVDASIGGKTGVNLQGTKNIVGTFCQPHSVLVDVSLLDTLPKRELVAGVAEMAKHGLIVDEQYFRELVIDLAESQEGFDPEKLERHIYRSCEMKRDIVIADEREGGVRKLLNFGHTFGHAFESLSHRTNQPLLHGEAIAIGIVAEAILSQLLGLLEETDLTVVREGLQKVGLPTTLPFPCSWDEVLPLLESDKKNSGGEINWTLLKGIGAGVVNQNAPLSLIEKSLQDL